MGYTIEIRTPSRETVDCRVVGEFTDEAWNSLWDDMQINEQQWRDWQSTVQSAQREIPLLPDLPQISKLAYIDEGAVHFRPSELHEECVRLMSTMSSDATRKLLRSLLDASDLALRCENADIVVHPFPV